MIGLATGCDSSSVMFMPPLVRPHMPAWPMCWLIAIRFKATQRVTTILLRTQTDSSARNDRGGEVMRHRWITALAAATLLGAAGASAASAGTQGPNVTLSGSSFTFSGTLAQPNGNYDFEFQV